MSSVEASFDNVSSWGEKNLVQFNPLKTQVSALTTKKIPFIVSPVFQNNLGLNVSSECQYRDHLESKAKLASKKLRVINRARRYYTSKHHLALYRALVRPHMEYCSISGLLHPSISLNQLIAYNVEPFESLGTQ